MKKYFSVILMCVAAIGCLVVLFAVPWDKFEPGLMFKRGHGIISTDSEVGELWNSYADPKSEPFLIRGRGNDYSATDIMNPYKQIDYSKAINDVREFMHLIDVYATAKGYGYNIEEDLLPGDVSTDRMFDYTLRLECVGRETLTIRYEGVFDSLAFVTLTVTEPINYSIVAVPKSYVFSFKSDRKEIHRRFEKIMEYTVG